jgi:hypothetical protein
VIDAHRYTDSSLAFSYISENLKEIKDGNPSTKDQDIGEYLHEMTIGRGQGKEPRSGTGGV